MDVLVSKLESGKRVLFITGAGISVNSGIPPYRGSNDAVWSNFVTDWATRKTFLSDPVNWWNTFYLATHYKTEFLQAEPNRGHDALAHICNYFENACVITQNVDGLHTRGTGRIKDDQLIEVHGSMHGGYKCIHSTCQSVERCIEENEIDLTACGNGFVPGEPDFKLEKCPTCPECSHPLLPQCLLFDEEYSSHPFYEWNAASDWMEDACAMVFVGTSFSVGLTQKALLLSRKKKAVLFNMNLNSMDQDMGTKDLQRMTDIFGPSQEMLPLLAHVVGKRTPCAKWDNFAPKHFTWQRNATNNGELVKVKAVAVKISTQLSSEEVVSESKSYKRKRSGSSRSSSRSVSRSSSFDVSNRTAITSTTSSISTDSSSSNSGSSSSSSSSGLNVFWTDPHIKSNDIGLANSFGKNSNKNRRHRKQTHPRKKENGGLTLLMSNGVMLK